MDEWVFGKTRDFIMRDEDERGDNSSVQSG